MAKSDNELTQQKAFPIRLVVAGVLVVLAAIFIAQNTGPGRVSFLVWHVEAPAWSWLIMVLLAGIIIGSVFPWFRKRS